jgi:hypothetical protein
MPMTVAITKMPTVASSLEASPGLPGPPGEWAGQVFGRDLGCRVGGRLFPPGKDFLALECGAAGDEQLGVDDDECAGDDAECREVEDEQAELADQIGRGQWQDGARRVGERPERR